jgi:hypothetical protein
MRQTSLSQRGNVISNLTLSTCADDATDMANDATPHDHPDRADHLNNLGNLLSG